MKQNCLSEEYEVFRLLKCPIEAHQYYVNTNNTINSISNKKWPNRIKFPEQLLEFVGKSIYIVESLTRFAAPTAREYEDITIEVYSVDDMAIFKGKSGILDIDQRMPATYKELSELCTGDGTVSYSITSNVTKSIFQLYFLNIVATNSLTDSYDAVFYDRNTALEYAAALRDFKRNKKSS